MRIFTIILLALALLCPASLSQAATSASALRNVKWGMTVEEVRKAEKKEGQWLDNCLVYPESMNGKKFALLYSFKNGRLCMAAYELLNKYKIKSRYLGIYEDFLKLLADKYGKPDESFVEGDRNLFSYAKNLQGELLAAGDARIVTRWKKKGTTIGLVLDNDGKKGNIAMHIMYICPPELLKDMESGLSDADKL